MIMADFSKLSPEEKIRRLKEIEKQKKEELKKLEEEKKKEIEEAEKEIKKSIEELVKEKKRSEIEEFLRQLKIMGKSPEAIKRRLKMFGFEEALIEELVGIVESGEENKDTLEETVRETETENPDESVPQYGSIFEKIKEGSAGLYELTNYNVYGRLKDINERMEQNGELSEDDERFIYSVSQNLEKVRAKEEAQKDEFQYLSRSEEILSEIGKRLRQKKLYQM